MKKILIAVDPYETRVAIVEENVVVETYVERRDRRSLLGNVYLAKVDNVLPGMEAAFLDAGLDKNGFLYVDEIVLPELSDRERRKKRIEQLIRNGQSLLVQVTKDPMGTKGARMTMDTSFAGRFLVYAPDGSGYGVSKRLDDHERDRLRDLVRKLKPKNGGGLIVRTAARGAKLPELERDLELLEAQWQALTQRAKGLRAPALVHQEVDLALEMVRDDLRIEVDEVVTDDEATYDRIRAYVEQHSPEFLPRIKLHSGQAPLMRRYQVEDGQCWWTKRYLGKHDVSYKGYNEGKGIWGLWEIPPSYKGGFHIWPESRITTGIDASMAKMWLSELEFRVADQCLQLHGGMGYAHDSPISAIWTHARVHRILLGTSEIHRVAIGKSLG